MQCILHGHPGEYKSCTCRCRAAAPGVTSARLISKIVRYGTAAVLAGLPALGAVLGILALGEVPGVAGWVSICVVTIGIVVTVLFSHR